MQGNARWGQVLNVEQAYLSSSHAFIRPLSSGVQENGSSEGRGDGTSRWGHEYILLCEKFDMLQPSLMDFVALMDGCTCGAQGMLGACPSLCLHVLDRWKVPGWEAKVE